jgi:hypothetical protein
VLLSNLKNTILVQVLDLHNVISFAKIIFRVRRTISLVVDALGLALLAENEHLW